MDCDQYLEAMSAASWGAIPVHLIIMAIFVVAALYVLKKLKVDKEEEDFFSDDDAHPYMVVVLVSTIIAIVFFGLGLARVHSAVFPQDTEDALYYCADHPPVIFKKDE